MHRSIERSRGTGPRATGTGHFLHKTAPFIVGRGPVPRHATIAGDRPPRYGNRTVFLAEKRHPLTVGRGPVPRHAPVYQTLAGDRPPRYGNRTVSWAKNGPPPRRARACPSPCCGLPNARGGQAPALREPDGFLEQNGPLPVGRGPVPRHAPV